MLAVLALALLTALGPAAAGSAGSPHLALAVAAIPDEPSARVLFEGPVYQAVAADLDGDRTREIVALTGAEGSTISVRAWRETGAGWRPIGEPVEVLPGTAGPGTVWVGSPIQLLVRDVGEEERVTLVRQPAYDVSDAEAPGGSRLDDLALGGDGLRLDPVAPARRSVDAIWVLDLDGDGTDELVASRSVPPLGDVSYPTQMFVHRWTGDGFDVLEQQLPIGSGDTPFLLGDSDGAPGEELGIIATAGRPDLHRISLAANDHVLEVEDAGAVVTAAIGVPLGDGRGIAVVHASGFLTVHSWPAGEEHTQVAGSVEVSGAMLLGVVDVGGSPRLVVSDRERTDLLRVLDLPDPAATASGTITAVSTAVTLRDGPIAPYVGPLPGGMPDARPAIVHAGRLIGIATGAEGGIPFAALAAAQPIGLVGSESRQLAILHGTFEAPIDPAGGRLDPPTLMADAAISVASFDDVASAEADAGVLDLPVAGGARELEDGTVLVSAEGIVARLEAPPGSRVYVGSDAVDAMLTVPDAGVLDVPIRPPAGTEPGSPSRVALTVSTPSGHSYLATWDVQVLDRPPSLAAAVSTSIGSGEVEVAGEAGPFAAVMVGGREAVVDADGRFRMRIALPPWPTDVEIVATDPVGNASTRTVSGIGWVDYRELPWIPIVAAGIGVAALVLFLRVPRPGPVIRRADDDAVLEEIEGD